MHKFKRVIFKFLYLLWGLIWYISSIAGFSSILNDIKYLSQYSWELGFLFSTFSFVYILYKLEKKKCKK